MSKTISIRVQPQTGRKAAGQRRHDLRDKSHIPDYVDQSRTERNSVLIQPPDPSSLRKEIEEHRRAAGQQALRADARTSIAGIISFGTEAQPEIEKLGLDQQNALFLSVAQSVARESGHELLGLAVHRDESAVHAHFTLRGYRIDERGREQAWRKDKKEMSRLQDIAGQVPEVQALGITRGVKKSERLARGDDLSKVVHRSVRQLHHDLPAEVEARQQQIDQLDEQLEDRRQQVEQLEQQQAEQQQRIDEQRAALEAEIEALREKAEKNARLVSEQEAKLEAGKADEEKARKRIEAYERRKEAADASLDEKREQLRELDREVIAKKFAVSGLGIEEKAAAARVEDLKKSEIEAAARVASLGTSEEEARARVEALRESVLESSSFLASVARGYEALTTGLKNANLISYEQWKVLSKGMEAEGPDLRRIGFDFVKFAEDVRDNLPSLVSEKLKSQQVTKQDHFIGQDYRKPAPQQRPVQQVEPAPAKKPRDRGPEIE